MRMAKTTPTAPLLKALGDYKSILISIGCFTALINVLMLVPSIYMLQVYDRVLSSQNETTLVMLSLMVVGFFAFIGLLETVRSFIVIRIGSQLERRFNLRVYQAAFERNLFKGEGNAGQSLGDLTHIRQFVTGPALFAFFDAPWFPVYLFVIYLFNVWLGVFATVGAVLLIGLAFLNEAITKKPLGEAGGYSQRSTQLATSHLHNAETIQAMGMLGVLRKRWFQVHSRFLGLQNQASDTGAVISSLSKTLRLCLQSLVLGLGALLVIKGDMTAGMMIAGSILMGRVLSPIDQLIAVWKQWSGAKLAYRRLDALLQEFPPNEDAMELPAPKGQVTFEQVSAGPPGKRAATLHMVNFNLGAGEVLGVLGASGSGKSTLARVLVGVWPTLAGTVRLDGADIHRWNRDDLGPYIGYLPQDIELFSGSVAENIARFREADPQKVVEAAQQAGVHEMILRLPQGYDTVLGEDGSGLSGGQKQRVALARALYGKPSLVVLDEPNSNLDTVGEAALASAIAQMKAQGTSVILVTHRSSALAQADKLLVLNEGRLQAFGPSQEVLKALSGAQQSGAQQEQPREKTVAAPAGLSMSRQYQASTKSSGV
ncbi:lipid A ABC transporter ATP-binding protein/permease MsbA [Pseudomonas sp. FW306-02-F02-AA]|uniref:Peptidase n=1 Tax=Pseudomonas fluorescens TaxID=294 RepID=A0A0N7H0U4_PSEFL|nr:MULTISPECIES: type I secretion system permease/ATPase [Pseudomonas]ALI04108.1 peptidase [Pseudomonas fluorescens]PMZ03304.1 lipid A ABC transporter ATP-binding protein/permease MsbA [Pseudomonas sp. FW306-02-F02-AB]PMZ07827.1 lipid A ABC transporter ATP-binding protein/permease MsbA [Pseudomonas sp. FW306-02-H06C]PMZ17955.1 lipid A ABC transporter ATP-binding protein/permease MsbA [Pseudomonas sp. FW306-02-F02-AA]PMZ23988.1 lipid A ABC transporter ATP-binding protein/permease MsbA [Pseudomo